MVLAKVTHIRIEASLTLKKELSTTTISNNFRNMGRHCGLLREAAPEAQK